MSHDGPSRRRVLRGTAAIGSIGLLGGLAGCQEQPGEDGTPTDGGGPGTATLADTAPGFASYLVRVEVSTLLNEDRIEAAAGDVLAEFEAAPDSLSALLDEAESSAGLDPRGLTDVLAFGDWAENRFGALVRADWTEDAIVSAAERSGESFQSRTYNGTTVYEGQDAGNLDAIGVLETGVFAVGNPATVEAVVDVARGDAQGVGGPVRSAYDAAQDGPVRFGFEMPADGSQRGGFEGTLARNVSTGYGSLTIGSEAVTSVTLTATSADAAASVAETARSRFGELERQMRSSAEQAPSDRARRLARDAADFLGNTSVSQDGETVTVRNTSSVAAVVQVVGAVVASFVLGLGSSPQPTPPQAIFEFEYDQSAGTVTVTHNGGDAIRRDRLSIRGSGFQSVAGADMTGPGTWQGSASGSVDGTPAVVAGDSVTVGVRSDYRLQVVWRSAEGDQSATLAEAEGPDA